MFGEADAGVGEFFCGGVADELGAIAVTALREAALEFADELGFGREY
jgi:hypothetical protein